MRNGIAKIASAIKHCSGEGWKRLAVLSGTLSRHVKIIHQTVFCVYPERHRAYEAEDTPSIQRVPLVVDAMCPDEGKNDAHFVCALRRYLPI